MEQQTNTSRRRRLRIRFPLRLAVWVALLAAVAALVGAGLHASGVIGSHSSKTTRLGFEDIGEMATQAAYTTQVNVTEGSRVLWGVTIPFTQSKYIYSYDVTIKAGIDFGGIDWDLDEEQKTIRVTMPETRVLSSEINLDSFKVYHESESIFHHITLEENNAALQELQHNAEETAIANGLTAQEMSFAMRAQPTYNEGIGAAIEDAMRQNPVLIRFGSENISKEKRGNNNECDSGETERAPRLDERTGHGRISGAYGRLS